MIMALFFTFLLMALTIYAYVVPTKRLAETLNIHEPPAAAMFLPTGKMELLSNLNYFKKLAAYAEQGGAFIPPGKLGFIALSSAGAAFLVVLAFMNISIALFSSLLMFLGVPFLLVSWKKGKLYREINKQLPGVLFSLSSSLKSGNTLVESMKIVGNDFASPLGPELRQVYELVSHGGGHLDVALAKSLKRLGNHPMLKKVFMAVNVSRQTGGNISLALDGVNKMVKDGVYAESLARSHSTQGKLAAVAFNLVPVFAVVAMESLTPGVVADYFFGSFKGQVLLFVSLSLIISAWIAVFFVLRKAFDF